MLQIMPFPPDTKINVQYNVKVLGFSIVHQELSLIHRTFVITTVNERETVKLFPD